MAESDTILGNLLRLYKKHSIEDMIFIQPMMNVCVCVGRLRPKRWDTSPEWQTFNCFHRRFVAMQELQDDNSYRFVAIFAH